MKPVPESVALGEYPDTTEHPLYRLTARCLVGWHELTVGESFRFSDENIRLSPQLDTTYEQWVEWGMTNVVRFGFPRVVVLYCPVCKRDCRMAPKGARRGV